jgi:hypothetical protein
MIERAPQSRYSFRAGSWLDPREFNAPVVGPPLCRGVGIDRLCVPETSGRQAGRVDSLLYEPCLHSRGPALRKRPVDIRPSLVVGVALDRKAKLRVLLQELQNVPELRARLGPEDVRTGVEENPQPRSRKSRRKTVPCSPARNRSGCRKPRRQPVLKIPSPARPPLSPRIAPLPPVRDGWRRAPCRKRPQRIQSCAPQEDLPQCLCDQVGLSSFFNLRTRSCGRGVPFTEGGYSLFSRGTKRTGAEVRSFSYSSLMRLYNPS